MEGGPGPAGKIICMVCFLRHSCEMKIRHNLFYLSLKCLNIMAIFTEMVTMILITKCLMN